MALNSLFAQLFIAIQQQIKNNVPEIRYIDQDLGQLEFYSERPAVAWPCVLVDFPSAQFSEHSQLQQWATITVSIRFAYSPFSSANSLAPDLTKEKALQYYEIENKLYQALHGFDADGCIQPMIRISAATEKREDPYRVREILFTTATEDDTATLPVNEVSASFDLEFEG